MQYRSLLEVLKWSDPDTALHLATVSRGWSVASNSQELWYSLIDSADFPPYEVTSTVSAKEKYRFLNHHWKQKKCFLVNGNQAALYNCYQQTWMRTWENSSLSTDAHCAAVFLSGDDVLVCGGTTSNCVIFRSKSGTVQAVASMQQVRRYHSAVSVSNVVYVFGGTEIAAKRSAESFDMTAWSALPEMITGRSSFNACVKDHLVYLCGGHTRLCEVFDVHSQIYTALPQTLGKSNWTVSFFYKDELISIIQETIYYHRSGEQKTYKNILIP